MMLEEAPMMLNAQYKLAQTLAYHGSDVKCVRSAPSDRQDEEKILTTSRDCTGVLASRAAGGRFAESQRFTGSSRYVNSCAYLRGDKSLDRAAQVFLGSLDSCIYVYDERRGDRAVQVISEHFDNVSTLDVLDSDGHGHGPLLISGSWDCTARVFHLGPAAEAESQKDPNDASQIRWRQRYVLKGHGAAVWSVRAVDHERFLTASADRSIRLFHRDRCVAQYSGHEDVVRSLVILPAHAASTSHCSFASASNDGTIRLWDIDLPVEGRSEAEIAQADDGRPEPQVRAARSVLRGHLDYVYDIALLGSDHLVSCGEDGTARIWDLTSSPEDALQQTIWHNVTSVWSVCALAGTRDIVTGSSDGRVRVFSVGSSANGGAEAGNAADDQEREERAAFERAAEELKARMLARGAGARSGGPVHAEVELLEAAADTGARTADAGVAGADAPAPAPGTSSEGEGATLYIDVSDASAPLPLVVRAGAAPRALAEEFVRAHSLPESYVARIVEFIRLCVPGRHDDDADAAQPAPAQSEHGQRD